MAVVNANLVSEVSTQMVGHWLTDTANFAAILYHELGRVNWVGFYFLAHNKLLLGPFVGKPACTEISIGRGVCGKSFAERSPLIVPDVDAFQDHIVCDSASRSEMVVPIKVKEQYIGVLDLDSAELNRFSKEDLKTVQECLQILIEKNPSFQRIPQFLD